MGLNIEVGMVADLLENDEEGAKWIQDEFTTLSHYLTSIGLQSHVDPTDIEVWSGDMWGYSGLHYLRRLAAHLHYTKKLPAPGNGEAAKDPVLQRYYEDFERSGGQTPFGSFDHLLIHSDAEGYYIPQDFPCILIPGDSFPVAGEMVGASQRLLDECKRLAFALQLPLDLMAEDDRVANAAESQGTGATTWEKYGMESYGCLQLYHAANHSIATGAAIVFC